MHRDTAVRHALLGAIAGASLSWGPLLWMDSNGLVGAAHLENVLHLWTLWIASQEGPVVLDTALANWPTGWRQVTADPINIPVYALFSAISPRAGFHAVQMMNLAAGGLAAAWAARVFVPTAPPLLTAFIATTTCASLTFLHTGMTEVGTLWLAVVTFAWVRRALPPTSTRPSLILAGVGLGLCAWGGPYTLIYGAILSVFATGAALRRPQRTLILLRAFAVATLGLLTAATPVWAVLSSRPEGLPGSSSLTLAALADPHNLSMRLLGADLMELVWPLAQSTARAQDSGHAPYLGLVAVALAGLGIRHSRPPALILGAIGALLALALGATLQVGDQVMTIGDQVLSMPAAWLTWLIPPLGRAGRWVRGAAVAGLLLAPLAAAGAAWLSRPLPKRLRLPFLAACGLLCAADGLLRGPLPWPATTTAVSVPPGLVDLTPRGPLLLVSAQRSGPARALPLYWQVHHGMPIDANPMFGADTASSTATRRALEALANRPDLRSAAPFLHRLSEHGFRWIVLGPRASDVEREGMERVLGPPTAAQGELVAWLLPLNAPDAQPALLP